MNTHTNDLTQVEEQELSDEQILTDIRRRTQAATIPEDFDARALAVRAVEQYWADREQGVVDREGRPLDDILIANRVALKRLRKDESGSGALNFLSIILPPLLAAIVLLLFPSLLNIGDGLFRHYRLIEVGALLLSVVAVILGLMDSRLKEKWLDEGNLTKHHLLSMLVGGLFAVTVISTIGMQTEKARQRAAEDRVARQRAEEELKSFSSNVANQQILEFSSDKMQEGLAAGNFENVSPPVETLPVGDKKIKLTRKKVSSDDVVYRAEGEPLPDPVEITLDKNSGLVKVEGSSEETFRFYAAVVKAASGDTLTLRVKNEDGTEKDLTWAINALTFKPNVGQRLFVVVDPKTNEPTDVTEFEPDIKNDKTIQLR